MSHAELLTLQRLGERLVSAYMRLIEALPKDARGISGMARYLSVHKATCQRIVEGATGSTDAIEALARFPGVRALQQHLAACRERGIRADVLDACAAAIAQMESELESRDLSRRGLIDHIASLRDETDGASTSLHDRRAAEQRRTLHNAAKGLTGEDLEAKIAIGVILPSRRHPGRLDIAIISALLGIQRESFSRPIAPFIINGWWDVFPTLPTGKRPGGAGDHQGPSFALLEEFSTAGLRTTHLAGGPARTLLVVDADTRSANDTIDVAVLFESDSAPSPLSDPLARVTAAARITHPTHLLISDVFIHPSLTTKPPRVACLALTAPPGDTPGGGLDECWYDRFPDTPRIVPLDLSAPIPSRAPRAERFAHRLAGFLMAHVSARHGVRTADLTGYRCMVKHPIWQSEYRAYFA